MLSLRGVDLRRVGEALQVYYKSWHVSLNLGNVPFPPSCRYVAVLNAVSGCVKSLSASLTKSGTDPNFRAPWPSYGSGTHFFEILGVKNPQGHQNAAQKPILKFGSKLCRGFDKPVSFIVQSSFSTQNQETLITFLLSNGSRPNFQ